jgi:hypothetical protein
MTLLLTFAVALVGTLLAGAMAYFIFKHFASVRAAGIAAFWLTVGSTGGRYSYSGPANEEAVLAFGGILGAALAFFVLWRWLLKRPAGQVTNADL